MKKYSTYLAAAVFTMAPNLAFGFDLIFDCIPTEDPTQQDGAIVEVTRTDGNTVNVTQIENSELTTNTYKVTNISLSEGVLHLRAVENTPMYTTGRKSEITISFSSFAVQSRQRAKAAEGNLVFTPGSLKLQPTLGLSQSMTCNVGMR